MTTPIQPLPCPLCGTGANVTRLPHTGKYAVYNVGCGITDDDSDSCGLVLFGDSGERRMDVVAKWNRRVSP